MPAVIDKGKCNGCELCALYCPLDVIHMEEGMAVVKYPDECWHCGACRQDCAHGAITFQFSPAMLGV
ncbi:MAG: 4Fe-4S binding protein [Alphaproteobacteria bacterium]|nr:4Fe-4S binding protein [Alphaproteobacteria bacterium]